MFPCSSDFSTIQAATTTTLGYTEQYSNKYCTCRQQQRTNGMMCKQATLSLKITPMKQSPFLLPKLQISMLLFLSLLFQCMVVQIHGQEESVPIRCLTDADDCEFSFSWQYFYDRENHECKHILCLPLTDGSDSVNRFSTQEECENICLTSKLTSLLL